MVNRILIIGESCTGKTTVAIELEKRSSFERFSCGEDLRNIANRKGMSSHRELDIKDYLYVDATATKLLNEAHNIIVEGRYIYNNNKIFDRESALVVRLFCSSEILLKRMSKKREATDTYDTFSPNQVAMNLYGDRIQVLKKDLEIDTGIYDVAGVVDIIFSHINK